MALKFNTQGRTRPLVAALLSFLCAAALHAQGCPHGEVTDTAGRPVAALAVIWTTAGRSLLATTDASGAFSFACNGAETGGTLHAQGNGLRTAEAAANGTDPVRLVARASATAEQVTVTATRSGVALGSQAETVVALDKGALQEFPALTLDERLRQVAGFELFRRSSSWVANPTSQGVSLRGLGSTAASRTLVLAEGAPLNDPFGDWVHWNEIPPDAVKGVNVATGGGSDLYGSSALGGVIDLIPTRPGTTLFEGTLAGAAEDTTDAHGRLDLRRGAWGESLAGEGLRTAGYVPTAPQFVGSIDRPANVHYQTGRVTLERQFGGPRDSTEAGPSTGLRSAQDDNKAGLTQRVFVTGNLLNEARGNGTEVQTNGSRIWRWLAGDEWTAGERTSGRVRVFGANEGYRQSFSSINAARSVETLTRLQQTATQEVGGSTDGSMHWSHVGVVAGFDVRDLRANDVERPFARGAVSSVQTTPARQRFVGGFAEALGTWGRWSGAASLRVDNAANLDTSMVTYPTAGGPVAATRIANREETVVSPRLGLVRELGLGFEVHGSGFRAFRAPSMNELYRQGQVGQELTLANSQLESERATGADGGVSWRPVSGPGAGRLAVESTYFWTEINRPVSAVLKSSTVTMITNQRENLGQIQSQGAEVRVQLNEGRAVSGSVQYQYAHAVVTAFSAQPTLVGRWIPQVPRQSVTMQLRATRARWGALTVAGRASGQAFDDSSNIYPLHRFFALDVYGERGLGRGFLVFVSVQNVLNQRMEVARTPLLTLGNPVLAQGGVRFGWGGRR